MTCQVSKLSFCDIFNDHIAHVPVRLERLDNARVLWINKRAMQIDPQFAYTGKNVIGYSDHILENCAFHVVAGVSEDKEPSLWTSHVTGFADRYGGAGIGHNGGSGRGVCLGNYQIKGVGRTPLVSRLTKEAHASGGAYLEECVRETIFSELVDSEFPYGSVPTLAIIDTGLVQTWHTRGDTKRERRTLLVRPQFLRPAHFQRAIGFVTNNPREGALDQVRIQRVFETSVAAFGVAMLHEMYESLWSSWSSQLAYSFVHRLPPGNNTTSNIAMDGRLVDFGAMSAVPSWANTASAFYPQPFVEQFENIVRAIQSLSYYFGRYFDTNLAKKASISNSLEIARKTYKMTICTEILKLCGLPESVLVSEFVLNNLNKIFNVVQVLFEYYQREQVDLIMEVPKLQIPWDIHMVWNKAVPRHLRSLRRILEPLVPSADVGMVAEICASRSQCRTMLYAPQMKSLIFSKLDLETCHSFEEDQARVSSLIEEYIQSSIRMPISERFISSQGNTR